MMKKKRVLAVFCRSCGGKYHYTTKNFRKNKQWNGGMFTLLPMYGPLGHNWTSFPENESVWGMDLTCPSCGEVYTKHTVRLERMELEVPVREEKKQEERPEGQESPTQDEEAGDAT